MSGSNVLRWLVGAGLLFVLLGMPFWEYRTDDTYIFLQYARNLSTGHGPSFNADQPVFGFSSPLWMLLLALLHRIGLGSLAAAKLLALLAGVGSIWGCHVFARQRLDPRLAGAATVAWAANAWLVRWSGAAMETAVVLCLVTWGLARFEVERREPERRPWSAFCFGLLVLARPEGALLSALALLVMFIDDVGARRRAAWTRAATAAAIIAALVVPWLVYAQRTMGTILPVTGAAKGTVGLAPEIDPLLDIGRIVATTAVLECVLLVIGLIWWLRRRGGGPATDAASGHPHRLPLAWLVTLPLFYAATGFDVLSRYALPVLPVVIVYGFVSLSALPRGGWWRLAAALLVGAGAALGAYLLWYGGDYEAVIQATRIVGVAAVGAAIGAVLAGPLYARRAVVVLLLAVALNGLVLARVVHPHTHTFSRGVMDCFKGMGEWFAANTPPDTQVAIADIGAFGYYSERRVLDMAALVSPEMIPLVDRYSIHEIAAGLRFADLAQPTYLIDRDARPARLDGAMQGVFELLPLEPCAIEGLGVRLPGTIYYSAYRLHWDRHRPAPEEAR